MLNVRGNPYRINIDLCVLTQDLKSWASTGDPVGIISLLLNSSGNSIEDRRQFNLEYPGHASREAAQPQVGRIPVEGRSSRANEWWIHRVATGIQSGQLAGVDGVVDLLTRTNHIGPIGHIIPGEDAEVICDLEAQFEAHFRHNAELGTVISSNIGLLSEQAP